jgi:putative ABC transport system substrate-binding protein
MTAITRRHFAAVLGGVATWPLAARAQQPAMPTIGYLSPRSPDAEAQLVAAFRRGLSETGYVEGRNVAIEFRWAEGRYDRLPILANMLVARATVMVTTGGPQPARAVLAATSTTPVVFWSGSDPIEDGLVKRFERPDGNATGFHVFSTSLGPKRLGLLRELVPDAREIAFLVNPSSQSAKMQVTQVQQAARAATARTRLDRELNRRHRVSLGGGARGAFR